LNVKTHSEDVNLAAGQYQGAAQYATLGFCSDVCFYQFWEKALAIPAEHIIGTDVERFHDSWMKYWNQSIVEAFSASRDVEAISKARWAVSIHSAGFPAFPWMDSSNKPIWQSENSVRNARTALAQNLERCGRTLDSAKEYENLRQYDKAKELREKDRHIVIKKTDISLNLNALLQQIKDNGLVAVYRCPHCGGKLKVDKNADISKLKVCEHCGSEIESMDLADFLKTALS
jgi:rubrerythrin